MGEHDGVPNARRLLRTTSGGFTEMHELPAVDSHATACIKDDGAVLYPLVHGSRFIGRGGNCIRSPGTLFIGKGSCGLHRGVGVSGTDNNRGADLGVYSA